MSFNLTILGSSSALPTSKRNPTAHVLNVHERFFLIDCGEGTQIQLRRFRIKFGRLNHIFISHLHGDHYFGLFGLLSTFSLLKRTSDLHIFSHPELENILAYQLKFLEPLSFKIIFHSLKSGKTQLLYEDNKLTIKSFPLKHRIPTFGFVFKEKAREKNIRKEVIQEFNLGIKDIIKIKHGADYVDEEGNIIKNEFLTLPDFATRSYAYCSDTAYFEKILTHIENIDLLYHEATFMDSLKDQAKATFHSTALQAATIAQKAKAKQLLIGHFSSRYKNVDKNLNEAKSIFPETIAVEDGDSISLEETRKTSPSIKIIRRNQ